MYTDRTHTTRRFLSAALALIVANGFAATLNPAFAQSNSTGRLSSHPNDLRDSFAKHPANVDTPKEFAQFVSQNPALGQRYARHFGVPQERIVSFFQTALVPHTLTRSQTLNTFGVTEAGRIYPVKTTLPAGTKVWATREGVPVLKWNCSNPLTSLLPGASLHTSPLEYASTPSPVLPEGTPVLDVPESTFTVASSEMPVEGGPLALAPPLPSGDFGFGIPTDVVGSAALPGLGEIIEAGGSSIEDFWPALFIPVIFAATQGGNSGEVITGETPPLTLPNPDGSTPITIPPQGPVIVPEVNTSVLLLGGLPVLGFAFLRTRRRKS